MTSSTDGGYTVNLAEMLALEISAAFGVSPSRFAVLQYIYESSKTHDLTTIECDMLSTEVEFIMKNRIIINLKGN